MEYKVDNKLLHIHQDEFISTNFRDQKYYCSLLYLAEVQVKNIIKKTGWDGWIDIDSVAQDATTRLIELYLKTPGYRILKDIPNRLYKEVQYQLYNPKKQKRDGYSTIDDYQPSYDEYKTDPIYDLDDITLYHLYTSNTFRAAVLAIKQSKKDTKYLYENATQLLHVYKVLKGDQCETPGKKKNPYINRPCCTR